MRNIFQRPLIAALLTSGLAVAQALFESLKTRRIDTGNAAPHHRDRESAEAFGRGHLAASSSTTPPAAETVAELKQRGVTVLSDVPDNGLLVSLERHVSVRNLGVRFAAPLDPADKISPLITSGAPAAASGFFLVEFHPDVDINAARGLVLNAGFTLRDHPDLNPHHLMIQTDPGPALSSLAQLDGVDYIFPASRALANGSPTLPCEGALTTNGATVQSIPTYGSGWDGPGLGPAALTLRVQQNDGPTSSRCGARRDRARHGRVVQGRADHLAAGHQSDPDRIP